MGLIGGGKLGEQKITREAPAPITAGIGALEFFMGLWLVLAPLVSTPGAIGELLENSTTVSRLHDVGTIDALSHPAVLIDGLARTYDSGGKSPVAQETTSTSTVPKLPFPDRLKSVSEEVHDRVTNATVHISTNGCLQSHSGTGVLVKGGILTNSHVVEGSSGARVQRWDGTEYEGRVIAYDPANELALLQVKDDVFDSPLVIGKDKEGETGYLYGYGNNRTLSASKVELLDTDTGPSEGSTDRRFEGVIRLGDSGAPVVNGKGQLLGINWARERSDNQIGHMRPAAAIRTFLSSLPTTDPLEVCQPIQDSIPVSEG